MNFSIFLRTIRINQYIKNAFCFLPLFFSGNFFDYILLKKTFFIFIAFCFASSVIYILNDIQDYEEDKNHPTKKMRPIASGAIALPLALVFVFLLILLSLFFAFLTSQLYCILIILLYWALQLFYIYIGKYISILDIACIALGFILRTISGSFAVSESLSQWLILMVFLLSMFLALGKRWDDACLIEDGLTSGEIRPSMAGYSKLFILSSMTFLSTIATVCYIMYTISPQIIKYYNSHYLYLTSVWVILGNLRYLQLSFVSKQSISPTAIMLHDRGIQCYVAFWFVHLCFLLYIN